MQHFELKGQTREVAGKAAIKAFRSQGLVPCNLYGTGVEGNVLFTVNAKDLKTVTDTPKAHIIDLVLDGGKKYTAVLHELQWHPVTDVCLHVDFLAVDENKAINIVTVDITNLGLDKRIKAGDIKLDKIAVTTDKDAIICGVKTTRNTVVASEEA